MAHWIRAIKGLRRQLLKKTLNLGGFDFKTFPHHKKNIVTVVTSFTQSQQNQSKELSPNEKMRRLADELRDPESWWI